jgi:hypothetical protein
MERGGINLGKGKGLRTRDKGKRGGPEKKTDSGLGTRESAGMRQGWDKVKTVKGGKKREKAGFSTLGLIIPRCKKRLRISPSPAGIEMSLTKLSLAGNN